jgi:hypothetical protein
MGSLLDKNWDDVFWRIKQTPRYKVFDENLYCVKYTIAHML